MAETTGSDPDCCVVGGGPAGVVCAMLLARQGVRVTLLEAQEDFDRDFRGDTVHPSTLEMLDGIGLADKVLAIDHVKLTRMSLSTADANVTLADFSHSGMQFPYIAMLPQDELLELLVAEAKRYETFTVLMGARATDLIVEDDTVVGLRFKRHGREESLRAKLVIGADGRGSNVRRLAGFVPVKASPPMDVMWMRVPRGDDERPEAMTGFRVGRGRLLVVFARSGQWQLGYIILKGTAREVRSEGLDALRESVAALAPELSERMTTLDDWKSIHFLSVESSRVPRWSRSGLLVIGDAAHVMSPAGGVGINYAIQDAVATANLLGAKLADGPVTPRDLEAVQNRRELPTKFIQWVQAQLQKQLVARALRDEPFSLPFPVKLLAGTPYARTILPRVIGMGLRPELVQF